MKTRIFGLAALILLCPATLQSTRADGYVVASVSDFYEPLGALGNWVEVPGYGWCWYPTRVAGDWKPYADGRWMWSEAGWYWTSDEPWAWACYHFGRWVRKDDYGWLWVPGTQWSRLPPEAGVVCVERVVIRRDFCNQPTSVVRAPASLSTSRPMLPIAMPGARAPMVNRACLDQPACRLRSVR